MMVLGLWVKENKIADGVWVVKKIVITVGALLPGASGRRDGSAESIAAANLIAGHTVDRKPPVAPLLMPSARRYS